MKAGDRVRAIGNCGEYFIDGDIAELDHKDSDGDWWAKFSNGQTYCVGLDNGRFFSLMGTSRDAAPDLLEVLENAKLFAQRVLSVSKPDVEMYKHEFQYNASQSIERIEEALEKARGEA